ncbi:glycosyl transferase family group 2-domain-containing protein [Protomyces lactucae-debilis]|uniref:Glycosyl transferase family group 2-domain-containing protein n=1 Tax=Protomyces lactucae-debilis TaxID=2754530 RepID=A0A1Y2FEP9_PROLT|nr:glycosyl transferase family group 2-domain-containing protein [Protomyces lactucae-debilis]ORY82430.1 glycosyl transferase family group 2-domain-containing protein [Protomyces lactucae-debilis]
MRTDGYEDEPSYLTAPHTEDLDEEDITLLDVAGFLQCQVVVAVTSSITMTLLSHLPPSVNSVPLDVSNNVQVIDTYSDFASLRRAQGTAFVRLGSTLLIWSDDVSTVLSAIHKLEGQIVKLVWNGTDKLEQYEELEQGNVLADRGVSLLTPSCVGLAILALAVFLGQSVHEIVLQIKADGNWSSLGIILYFPITLWLAAFFAQTFALVVFYFLGPMSHLGRNTKYYSAIAPPRRSNAQLPHITVQCPIYKEDLELVIEPALLSVKTAIKTYEMQGGSVNIFVNDDGMQVISARERQKRRQFYKHHNIGWVARPPDNEHFVRAGKFKKASNMNYAMYLSHQLEEALTGFVRPSYWTDGDETAKQAELTNDLLLQQQPPALGDGDIRIGELILLIDADTRVPQDCFLDAANEFAECPGLAILQHTSLAFQVTSDNYWEDCMAYFTMFIAGAIQWMTAGGDVAPFVGHNAFLRWSAVQELSYETDGRRKWWSEQHVSEDFELSLKLQNLGYIVRQASYSLGEFKEGVSLTVYDEIDRWQKYAFGVFELVFHPFMLWPTRGPFTPLFRACMTSKRISAASKFTLLAYFGTYPAIASQWLLTLINYFLIGWFEVNITKLYQSSFQIIIATLVVFDISVPCANAVFRFRSHQSQFVFALLENFKWIALLCVFFGGLSLHITKALIYHLFGIPLVWSSTAKTLERSYFLKELPMIWHRFKYMYAFVFVASLVCVVLALSAVPIGWRIEPSVFTGLPVAWTLACHAASPVILNPQSFLSEIL